MRSLRRTLVITLLATVTAATAAGAVATYRIARSEIDAIFDYHLRQLALTVRAEALGPGGSALRGDPDLEFVVEIFRRGALLYASTDAPDRPDRVATLGFATVDRGGRTWRAYAVVLGDDVLQVAQPLDVRADLAIMAALRTLLPLLFVLPAIAIAVGWLVRRALAPLARIASAASARSAASLEPFTVEGVPEEALPLVQSLNALLGRLDAALTAQRAFVADAAHELRTPLAALKLQAQLAARAPDPDTRTAAMRELDAGLSRATHAVEQLLALARAEPGAAAEPSTPVQLSSIAGEIVAQHARFAEANGIDLGVDDADEEAVVRGDAAALRTLLANLVDNAIRYTPRGGRVDVSTGLEAGRRPWIEVADTGPGIPAAERGRVFDRFHRRAGAPEGGSGLGLAIVRAVAQRHGAKVDLRDAPGGGLVARVEFPAIGGAPDEDRPR